MCCSFISNTDTQIVHASSGYYYTDIYNRTIHYKTHHNDDNFVATDGNYYDAAGADEDDDDDDGDQQRGFLYSFKLISLN